MRISQNRTTVNCQFYKVSYICKGMFEQSSMDWGKFAYLLSHHLSHRRRMNLNENRLLPYLVVVKVTCKAHRY